LNKMTCSIGSKIRCLPIVALALILGCIDPDKETECLSDSHCASGMMCINGTCEGDGDTSESPDGPSDGDIDADVDSDSDSDSDTENGLPGCNGNAEPLTSPSDSYLTIDVSGTLREYVLELPDGYDGQTPVPVVFTLHGMGATAQGFLGSGYGDVRNGIAGRAMVVGLQGLSRNGRTGWAAGGGIEPADFDFFDALVAELKAEYCVDPQRIFAMGHGDGAMFANELGCGRSDVLRGVGPVAGWGPIDSCGGKVAAMVVHNPDDDFVVWSTYGWPTVQFWTDENECGDPGTMPTEAFPGDGTTGAPLPCQAMPGCDADYPVTLCLHDYTNQWDGADAFPSQWGGDAVTEFFLALSRAP
jgi:polyhydroxybutyrate depolymerase